MSVSVRCALAARSCRLGAGVGCIWAVVVLLQLASVGISAAAVPAARESTVTRAAANAVRRSTQSLGHSLSRTACIRAAQRRTKKCRSKASEPRRVPHRGRRRSAAAVKKRPQRAQARSVTPSAGSVATGTGPVIGSGARPDLPGTPLEIWPIEEKAQPIDEKPVPVEEPASPKEKAPPAEEPPLPEEAAPREEEKAPPEEEKAPPEEQAPPVGEEAFRFFSPTSFWNAPVPADAAIDPISTAAVTALTLLEIGEQTGTHRPSINTTSWSVPIYTVPAGQPTVRVALVKGYSVALQAAWAEVPLPPDAHPAVGTDEHLVVWQPSTDRMWEFWHLEKMGESWRAAWGGAMQNVSTNSGVYGAEAWPEAQSSWGASASSLPLAGGLITLEDLQRGEIDHALAISIPNVRQGVYASPAQRTDGSSKEPLSLPEGAHLRLDPTLDLASLHLPPFTLMLARAAQRYGIFVRDIASNLALYAQDPSQLATNPYSGPHGYFEGQSPSTLLAAFPWSHLQLLKMELSTVR